MHKITDSVEALPICEEPTLISIHFTEPKQEVIFSGPSLSFDIAADNDSETGEAVLMNQ